MSAAHGEIDVEKYISHGTSKKNILEWVEVSRISVYILLCLLPILSIFDLQEIFIPFFPSVLVSLPSEETRARNLQQLDSR